MPAFSLAAAQQSYLEHEEPKRKKRYPIDATLQRDLERGWMLDYLLDVDSLLYGRWDYWAQIQLEGKLPEEPVPRIDFTMSPGPNSRQMGQGPGRQMWERCLNALSESWRGWSSWEMVNYLLDWLLFGFGQNKELPDEPQGCTGASMRLYQLFDIWPLLLWPYDHLADLLAETGHGKRHQFYATPHNVVEMMTAMTMEGQDYRAQTVNDPACGTARMLLHASNHSLRLYGIDIDPVMCKCSAVNGFLYAPWLARPFEWDEQNQIVQSEMARTYQVMARIARMMRFIRGEQTPDLPEPEELIPEPNTGIPEPVEQTAPATALFEGDYAASDAPKTTNTRRRKVEKSITTQLILEM